eukprot:scaffold6586_cov34-Tisochrysis_lutea.AAC.2
MCKWPVWLSAAGFVSEVPGTGSEASELGEDEARPAGFVDPTGFEQLWCPEDLPLPSCHLAVGVVLKVRRDKPCPPAGHTAGQVSRMCPRMEPAPVIGLPSPIPSRLAQPCHPQDGAPAYMFPCLETSVTRATPDGRGAVLWHNRGLNSVPLGSTWMGWGKAGPPDALVLSTFTRELPPQHDDTEAQIVEDLESEPASWDRLLEPVNIGDAVRAVYETIADAPDKMGEGYQYLIARVPETQLPEGAVKPGRQLGFVLTDALCSPDLNDADWQDEAGCFAASDIAVLAVPPGGKSDFMPEVYKALYKPSSIDTSTVKIEGIA